jgi:hypothetical protein
MTFAIIPDEGPPRLFRYFYGGEEMPIAMLDRTHNLLFINRDKFSKLSNAEQHIVMRTHAAVIH